MSQQIPINRFSSQTNQLTVPNLQLSQQQQQQQRSQQSTILSTQYPIDQSIDLKPNFALISNASQSQSNINSLNLNMSSNSMNSIITSLNPLTSGINNIASAQFQQTMSHCGMTPFLMNPGKRAETFVVDEIKLMLNEIEARKHILLSISPSTNRLKRRAWEEVAICMANKWSHAPRRTADQVRFILFYQSANISNIVSSSRVVTV